jgi:mannose-6-phosphate isomerase-like protein (cupin superfamily)
LLRYRYKINKLRKDMGYEIKVPWISDVTTKDKPWGLETTWATTSTVSHCKIINIKKGHRTSLKKYQVKNESFYLISGKLEVMYGDHKTTDPKRMVTTELNPKQALSVPSGCPYRLTALEDSVIIESSDRVETAYEIIEDDYKR